MSDAETTPRESEQYEHGRVLATAGEPLPADHSAYLLKGYAGALGMTTEEYARWRRAAEVVSCLTGDDVGVVEGREVVSWCRERVGDVVDRASLDAAEYDSWTDDYLLRWCHRNLDGGLVRALVDSRRLQADGATLGTGHVLAAGHDRATCPSCSPRLGDRLPNGATVVEVAGDVVLALYRDEYVTWRVAPTGETTAGRYCGSGASGLLRAARSLVERGTAV